MTEQNETLQPLANCVTERRIGRFSITAELLESVADAGLAALFAHFAIVRAEHLHYCDTIEYVAYSPLFGVAREGEIIPQYKIQTTITDGVAAVVAHTWGDHQAANQTALDEIAAAVGVKR